MKKCSDDLETANYFEKVAKNRNGKISANWIINDLFGRLNKEGKTLKNGPISADQLGGIIDLISRAILPEVIELGVLLTRVSVTETEIVKAPPNGQIVDACLHSANICISTIISFFEKLSNLQAFPTMITRCEVYTAASIPITVDWELLLSRLGELGDESDGIERKFETVASATIAGEENRPGEEVGASARGSTGRERPVKDV